MMVNRVYLVSVTMGSDQMVDIVNMAEKLLMMKLNRQGVRNRSRYIRLL